MNVLFGRNGLQRLTVVVSVVMFVTSLLLWHTHSQRIELIEHIHTVTERVVDLNRTINELRSDLSSSGGCSEQKKSHETERAKYQDSMKNEKDKKLEELTKSASKLEEDLKRLRTEHVAANTSIVETTAKLAECHQACNERVNATCVAAKSLAIKRKSLFQYLFNSS
jgi:DNA repair exonuclease SbcCD ATPase subunit